MTAHLRAVTSPRADQDAAELKEPEERVRARGGASKRDRAFALLREQLELRRSVHGWSYARRGERVFRFDGPGRQDLYAEARHLWRTFESDDPPDDRTLRSVVADLRRAAAEAPVDDAVTQAWLQDRGVESAPAVTPDRGLSTITALEGCPLPDGYRIPAPYTIAPDGVWLWHPRGDLERVAWAALVVSRVFTDPEGEQMVELAWRDRSRWRRRIVPRSTAKSGRRLVRELGDFGLPVTEADAKAAERWLAAAETANQDVIEEVTIARHLGWQADGQFVTAAGQPYEIQGIEPQLQRALAAHHPRGTLADWQTTVKIVERYPRAAIAVYAGLGAPLLEVLGVPSFTVNWGGTSTTGKTTAAQGGLSCWANPDEAAGAITSWSATTTAYQARLALAGNGVAVLFDDTQTASRPENVSDVLYQISQNQGKGRMGEWRTYRWRTIVLSTGERSALSFATHQGISARVLDLSGPPFGRTERSGADAEAFRRGLTANYGVAGPAFVQQLRAYLDEHGPERLVSRHQALTDLHRQDASNLARRRAPLVAVLRLASELAYDWGIVPFPSPSHEVWNDLFAANDPRDNRAELALDVVREYVAMHAERFYEPKKTPPAAGWIGKRTKVGDDARAVALIPQQLREFLARAGYELDAVIQGWREMKVLHEQPKQRPPYLIKQRIGTQIKCYVFTGTVFDDGGDGDDA